MTLYGLRSLLLLVVALGGGVPVLAQAPATAPAQVPPVHVAIAHPPSVIYLMRHAEKPPGTDQDPNLTPIGYKRAELLPTLFVAKKDAAQAPRLLRPDVLFATAHSKHSDRPVETLTPLSVATGLSINHSFEDHDTAGIASEVLSGRYGGKVIVISWHHGELPHLAQALGVTDPPHWEDTTFNQIWQIRYVDGHATLTPIAENLLPGDPATVQ